uniref:BHLH domain-containing protein n=1 Tax=Panagrolaimus superbus TaxID=310955 RepID=A0A914YZE2_9BILA
MSTTTQDSTNLSAAERRQRRKERILNSADARLEKLLPGSISSSVEMTQEADKFSEYSSSSSLDITPDERAPIFNIAESMGGKAICPEPSFIDLIDVYRVQVCVIIGVIFRILTLLHMVNSILPLWITISVVYYSYLLSHAPAKFSMPGYILNFLHAGRINEKAVRYFGVAADTLWSVSSDTMIMAFGFLVSHIVIFAVNLMF